MTEALVLGGGGVGGIAWMTGLLTGLADSGRDISGADVLVGTSAGATVAAQLGSGSSLEELYARQVEPGLQSAEIAVDIDMEAWARELAEVMARARTGGEMRRAAGAFALGATTVSERERRAVIESRLPATRWPERTLRIVAVDALDGATRVFDRTSGVSLVDAVAASCAVPGVWPPVTIDGRRYVDGGVRSTANADCVPRVSRVTVIVPLGAEEVLPTDVPLEAAVSALRTGGAEVSIIAPDERSHDAIGGNPLDPATRGPAAAAGREQGRRLAGGAPAA